MKPSGVSEILNNMKSMDTIIQQNQVLYCLTCGKCSSVCPITRWEDQLYTSPRLLVEKVVGGDRDAIFEDPLLWSCLTCRQCTQLCPSQVDFCGFIRDLRALARSKDLRGTGTHGDIVQTWAQMMTHENMNQNRLSWLQDKHAVSPISETIYFSGCLPYYEVLFHDMGVEALAIARAAVSIMNQAGIVPHVMPNERCCGHDQLWQGDLDTFGKLARRNLSQFEASKAKQIVTTCPECAYTLKYDYPRYGMEHGLKIMHMSEWLANLVDQDRIAVQSQPLDEPVTFQDPCRLARHMGIWAEPRAVLAATGSDLVEMQKNKTQALCCGTSCWTACGRVNKQIQTERLTQAKATGADVLVTACIKCQIHLKCAQKDRMLQDDIDMEIRDMTTLVADNLGFKDSRGQGSEI